MIEFKAKNSNHMYNRKENLLLKHKDNDNTITLKDVQAALKVDTTILKLIIDGKQVDSEWFIYGNRKEDKKQMQIVNGMIVYLKFHFNFFKTNAKVDKPGKLELIVDGKNVSDYIKHPDWDVHLADLKAKKKEEHKTKMKLAKKNVNNQFNGNDEILNVLIEIRDFLKK